MKLRSGRFRWVPGVLVLAACGSESGTEPLDECPLPSNPAPVFISHLTDLSLHSTIHPMGAPWGGGIHENGHTYLQIEPRNEGVEVPVYSPVNARLERILHHVSVGDSTDWAFTFRVSCEVTFILTHITDPVPALQAAWTGPPAQSSGEIQFLDEDGFIPVSAGDFLGTTTGTPQASNWDFGVYHTDHINDFINPDRHHRPTVKGEFSRALNSVCPYDFFAPSLRMQYEAMYGSILTNRPEPGAHCRQGSRDVPGTVAGSWWRISGDPAHYGPVAGITSEFGGHVLFGAIGHPFTQTVVESDIIPEEVTGEQCWQNAWEFVFLRLNPDETLHAYYGEGVCPEEFPGAGFGVYER